MTQAKRKRLAVISGILLLIFTALNIGIHSVEYATNGKTIFYFYGMLTPHATLLLTVLALAAAIVFIIFALPAKCRTSRMAIKSLLIVLISAAALVITAITPIQLILYYPDSINTSYTINNEKIITVEKGMFDQVSTIKYKVINLFFIKEIRRTTTEL